MKYFICGYPPTYTYTIKIYQNHPLQRQEAKIYGYRVMYAYIIRIYIYKYDII